MATGTQIQDHYDVVGPMHALRMEDVHECPDYTCAFFDGKPKSYVQAQADKHAWIFDGLGLGQNLSGKRVLDIGCGWGPMLNAARKRGGKAIGFTLSPGQVDYCEDRGLDARLRNYKHLGRGELGIFDGIVSLGAFEHFCSIEDQLAGKQKEVYRNFFKICAERLPAGCRLFLQTMTWGKSVPDYRQLSLNASKDSPEAILARMEHLYPGSWPPDGLRQLVDCASKYFDFVSHNNGRLDYIETLKGWDAATPNLWKPHNLGRTLHHAMPIAYGLLTSRSARIQMESICRGDQRQCFEREIMSHERIFFVKKRQH